MDKEIEELWRTIPGYPDTYQVSNLGRVRSCINPGDHKRSDLWHIVKGIPSTYGHLRVTIKGKLVFVHRLVALAWIPNPNNYPIINHKNEDPADNRVENLEWCTVKYNNSYGTIRERIRSKHINHPSHSKSVKQFSIDGKLLNSYPSVAEASRVTGISKSSINKFLSGKIKSPTTGFLWSYDDSIPSVVDRYSLYKPRPVAQYTLDGRFVKEFISMSIAARETGISQGNIYGCCIGKRKRTGLFTWRYKDA